MCLYVKHAHTGGSEACIISIFNCTLVKYLWLIFSLFVQCLDYVLYFVFFKAIMLFVIVINVFFYFSFFDTYGDNVSQLTPYSLNSSLKGELSRKMVQNNEIVNDFILQ